MLTQTPAREHHLSQVHPVSSQSTDHHRGQTIHSLRPHFAFLQTMESLHKGLVEGKPKDCLSVGSSGHVSFYLCLQSVIEQSEFSLFLQKISNRISKSRIGSKMYFCYSVPMGLCCNLTLWGSCYSTASTLLRGTAAPPQPDAGGNVKIQSGLGCQALPPGLPQISWQ